MRKRMRRLLAMLLILTAVVTAAAGEEDVEIEELLLIPVEDDYDPFWTFPIALEDMKPDYIRLANKHYLLESDYVPEDMVNLPQDPDKGASKGGVRWDGAQKDGKLVGQYLREECAQALLAMNAEMRAIADAKEKGWEVMYVKSAYRSYSKQSDMYSNRLEKMGKDDGWVAKPGTSDHQTGLGVDFIPYSWTKKAKKHSGMNSKMAKEVECQWMAEHCQEYGFIIRYPEDKQEITEINYEPWHLRYVGIPVATYIMENGLCLEEFTEQLQAAIEEYIAQGGDPAKVEAYIQKPTE